MLYITEISKLLGTKYYKLESRTGVDSLDPNANSNTFNSNSGGKKRTKILTQRCVVNNTVLFLSAIMLCNESPFL